MHLTGKDKNMKPTIQFSEKSRQRFGEMDSPRGVSFPKTDYYYQGSSMANMGGRRFESRQPSFRSISKDYFKYEAPHTFLGEVALFSVIVMTAAVPIMASVGALIHLVRSFGIL
jgi:hypothetical protein